MFLTRQHSHVEFLTASFRKLPVAWFKPTTAWFMISYIGNRCGASAPLIHTQFHDLPTWKLYIWLKEHNASVDGMKQSKRMLFHWFYVCDISEFLLDLFRDECLSRTDDHCPKRQCIKIKLDSWTRNFILQLQSKFIFVT